jgi:hypothetical protein
MQECARLASHLCAAIADWKALRPVFEEIRDRHLA